MSVKITGRIGSSDVDLTIEGYDPFAVAATTGMISEHLRAAETPKQAAAFARKVKRIADAVATETADR